MDLLFTIAIALVMSTILMVEAVKDQRHREEKVNVPVIGQWSFQEKKGGTRNLKEGYGRIYSDTSCIGIDCGDASLCIELRDKDPSDDKKLTLGNCLSHGWRLDIDGLFHSEKDDTQCMQAGRSKIPEEGEMIRMYSCDPSNKLQEFVYEEGKFIKPKADLNLCVVWQGVTPNLYKDNIIMKECDEVNDRSAWSGDFPIETRCSLTDPQQCALYNTYSGDGPNSCPSFLFHVFVEHLCPDLDFIPSYGIDVAFADEWCTKAVPEIDADCVDDCISYLQDCCPWAPTTTNLYDYPGSVFTYTDTARGYAYNASDIPGGVERIPNSSGDPDAFEYVYDDTIFEWLSYDFQVMHFNGFINSSYGTDVESIEKIWAWGISHDGLTDNLDVQFGITAVTGLSEEAFFDAVNSYLL